MKIWIKLILILLIRNFLRLFYIFKIKNNRIISFCYGGKQYSCNPKYILEYILSDNKKYEIIFAVNDIQNFLYLQNKNIKLVKFKSIKFLYYCLTSKVFITNGMPPKYIPFRKEQFVLSTWHGGGAYKKGGLDIINNLPSKILIKLSANSLTAILSSCKKFTEVFHNAFLINCDLFFNSGLPRNDILINKNKSILYKKVFDYFELDSDYKIVLYAPTYRSFFVSSVESDAEESDFEIDFDKLKKALNNKFESKWKILYRAHYFLSGKKDKNFIDATNYPDMQELLYVSDILITDYSSCMWDFSLMYKPCFIYATDIDQYKQERDFYTPMSEWPFPIATNTDELINNILNFNQEEYVQKVKQHHKDLGSFEDGHACERVCKLIEDIIDGKVKN